MRTYLFNRSSTLLLIASLSVLCTGCPPTTCNKGGIDMEPPTFPLGRGFTAPGLFYDDGNGLTAILGDLTLASGVTYFNNAVIVDGATLSFGTKQVLRVNNTALNIVLKPSTLTAQFDYFDQGGTINLSAGSGTGSYVGNMYTMPVSHIINGVTIEKINFRDIRNSQGVKTGEMGTIQLKSSTNIDRMKIGGQELFVDNFCFN